MDQDFKFRQDKGDLGIRVQTSGKSDPTAREAIRNVELDRDVKRYKSIGS